MTTSATIGRYKNHKSGTCLEDPGYSARSGTRAKLAACSTSAAERVTFEGAFFVVHKLCLQLANGKPGAAITWATCNGNDRQQWSVNPDGTITWIQFTMCLADMSGKVELANCTRSAANRWTFIPART